MKRTKKQFFGLQGLLTMGMSAGLACGGTLPATMTGGTSHEPTPREAPRIAASEVHEQPPAPGGPTTVSFPTVARQTLDNGLEINVAERHNVPLVTVSLVIRSGRIADPPGLPGVASLVTQMLKQGTRQHSAQELAEALEFLGAELDARVGSGNITLSATTLREHAPRVVELLSEMVGHPAFDAAELAKLRTRERDRLAVDATRPTYLAMREWRRAFYGEGHPDAVAEPTPETLRRVRRRDLVSWHRTYVRPDNAQLTVVGDVSLPEVEAMVESGLGNWTRPTTPIPTTRIPPPPDRTETSYIFVSRPGAVQTSILVGGTSVERADPRFEHFVVANQILGESPSSRLQQDLRARRSLTYGAYSRVREQTGVAPWIAWTSVRTDVTMQALDALEENLRSMVSTPPPAEELSAAQHSVSDAFPFAINTNEQIALKISDARLFALGDDYWDNYRSAIQAVTPEHVMQAAQTSLRADKLVFVLVGDAERFVPELRRRGQVTVLDANGDEIQMP